VTESPTSWMPPDGGCRYVRYWAAVKTRCHLTVTNTEKSTRTQIAGWRPNTKQGAASRYVLVALASAGWWG
jgi:hypothetical protein